jgi:HK97 family phage portal protein
VVWYKPSTWGESEARTLTAENNGRYLLDFAHGGGAFETAHVSQERALTLSYVFAAVRVIAGTISTLPLKSYRDLGDSRQPMATLPRLFEDLRTSGQLRPWLHRFFASLALRGNAFGLIVSRDGFGFPTAIDWLDPSRVTINDAIPGRPEYIFDGRLVRREDIVHVPWFPLPGQVLGLSPIGAFARTMGTGLHAETYGSDWFAGGGFPPGTFRNTEKQLISAEEAEVLKARLVASIRSRKPIVYGKDWEYNPVNVPAGEAQFLQTIKATATQIAHIYGIPPEEIGGETGSSMTYATVELNQIKLAGALRQWMVTFEEAMFGLLPERQYVRFNADALVRTDLRTRWEVNKIRVAMGAASIDEIRMQEDEPLLPTGRGRGSWFPRIRRLYPIRTNRPQWWASLGEWDSPCLSRSAGSRRAASRCVPLRRRSAPSAAMRRSSTSRRRTSAASSR